MIEEGFEFDSSIFPVVHDTYGIPDAPRFPYVRAVNGGGTLNEFPPSTLRILGVNFPIAGGGYLRLLPYSFTAWAIRRINEVERQPAMVYLHPWELDPDQPRVAAPWRSRFRHYQNLDTTEAKCGRLFENFAWGPMELVFAAATGAPERDMEVGYGFENRLGRRGSAQLHENCRHLRSDQGVQSRPFAGSD